MNLGFFSFFELFFSILLSNGEKGGLEKWVDDGWRRRELPADLTERRFKPDSIALFYVTLCRPTLPQCLRGIIANADIMMANVRQNSYYPTDTTSPIIRPRCRPYGRIVKHRGSAPRKSSLTCKADV